MSERSTASAKDTGSLLVPLRRSSAGANHEVPALGHSRQLSVGERMVVRELLSRFVEFGVLEFAHLEVSDGDSIQGQLSDPVEDGADSLVGDERARSILGERPMCSPDSGQESTAADRDRARRRLRCHVTRADIQCSLANTMLEFSKTAESIPTLAMKAALAEQSLLEHIRYHSIEMVLPLHDMLPRQESVQTERDRTYESFDECLRACDVELSKCASDSDEAVGQCEVYMADLRRLTDEERAWKQVEEHPDDSADSWSSGAHQADWDLYQSERPSYRSSPRNRSRSVQTRSRSRGPRRASLWTYEESQAGSPAESARGDDDDHADAGDQALLEWSHDIRSYGS
jgi:hypothetical protein